MIDVQPARRLPRLPRSFFRRDPVTVARALLGQHLVSHVDDRLAAGVIVETEAYLGTVDRAAHTFDHRRTPRNETMWGEAGHCYVYFVYGMHHCANVVAGGPGDPVAVLIRALEPVAGLEVMFERRAAARRPADLCSGPAKLCQALGITVALDGADLVCDRRIGIERARQRALPGARIGRGPRIGIDYAGNWRDEPLRFWVRDNPHVSR
jgi:DNA-3-methyladenine glycosylase